MAHHAQHTSSGRNSGRQLERWFGRLTEASYVLILSWSTCVEVICRKILTLGRTSKIIPAPWYKRGFMEPLPRVFDMLQYFETILSLTKSLWFSQQDEVYFMGGGAAGGLWRHQEWSPSWPPSWILPRIRNQVKIAVNGSFLCSTCKITSK